VEKLSNELFGYELPQILLIHCNELNSISLRQSIDRMRKRGYQFITLEEAMLRTGRLVAEPHSNVDEI